MKPTKLSTVFILLFITTTVFAQKVHYKDRYYTIVKSKIFHRGYDVYGRLSPGKIDTIYIIAKELYTENGKLKDKYKKRKKRDRYKLPEGFWQQKNAGAVATARTNLNKVPETTVVQNEAENTSNISTAPAVQTISNSIKEKETEEERQIEVAKDKKETKEVTTEKTQKVLKDNKSPKKITTTEERKKIEKEGKQQQESSQKNEAEYKTAQAKQKKEQERPREVTRAKEAKNSTSKQVEDQQSKLEKSIAKEKNKTKKSKEKLGKETKKLESKKGDLQKEKTKLLKKEKSLETKAAAAIASAGLASATLSKKETFGTIYIKINTEKTSTTRNGDILLFFDVINNSNKDLVILKPNNSIDIRIDFFSNTMECEDIPIKSTDYLAKDLTIKDDDYLTIPANTKIELFVNGTYRNWLACNSEDVVLQIQYNPFQSAEEGIELQPPYKKELHKALKKITPIKIESENIKFKLNKQQ